MAIETIKQALGSLTTPNILVIVGIFVCLGVVVFLGYLLAKYDKKLRESRARTPLSKTLEPKERDRINQLLKGMAYEDKLLFIRATFGGDVTVYSDISKDGCVITAAALKDLEPPRTKEAIDYAG